VTSPGRFSHGLVVLALALVLAHGSARGETPESIENPRQARSGWVTDAAGVLSPGAEASIDSIAASLQRATGHELALVTVRDAGGMTPKEFATTLFNAWGIGQAGRDDGVLVLIATDVHRIEVETGYGAEAVLPDGRVGRILDEFVVPHLREGDWDGAAVECTREFARVLTKWETEAQATDRRRKARSLLALLVAGGTALLALLGFLVSIPIRFWRRCPKCHRRMKHLSERDDDAYLAEVELFEEQIRSVDHRVWRCDSCAITRIEHYKRWLSGYSDCPKCKRTTLATTSLTLLAATYQHAGQKEVTNACEAPQCGYKASHIEVLAKLVHSTSSGSSSGGSRSSGGSSFGGGRSGGGGAGRSW